MADVLLVDDDNSVLLTLAIALRRQGHNVTVATNGENALEILQKQGFAFLISDVRMPGISGFDLARQARQMPQPPRVILTSAYSNLSAADGQSEAFLQKPVDLAHLAQLLAPQNENTTRENYTPSDHRPLTTAH